MHQRYLQPRKYSNKVLFNDLKKLNIYVKRFLIIIIIGHLNHKLITTKDKLTSKDDIQKENKVFKLSII